MKIMPLGDYYVWHCDWCDSTNYTIRTRMEHEGLACAACHKQFPEFTDSSSTFSRLQIPESAAITSRCKIQRLLGFTGRAYVQR